MGYVAGVDVGSTQAKAVVLDERGRVAGEAILDVEMNMGSAAQQVFERVVANAGLNAIARSMGVVDVAVGVNWPALALLAPVTLLVAALGAYLPARGVARISVGDALRYE